MSATGVTDWYSTAHNDYDRKQRGQPPADSGYPLAFLREAALKIGPEFYSATPGADELAVSLFRHYCLPPRPTPRGPGTMLPFGTGSQDAKCPGFSNSIPVAAHPSVKTWIIQTDLSVDIHRVGLVSYTGQMRAAGFKILAAICGLVSSFICKRTKHLSM
ncbi:uncharacterized protein BDV17DRAFT_291370 [Aspergillus undulatus]|uniref:uncharacterized protein n=1 Tax=Aspergillus undulatus TaxID=1810928 RepID=UPI003CCD9066